MARIDMSVVFLHKPSQTHTYTNSAPPASMAPKKKSANVMKMINNWYLFDDGTN